MQAALDALVALKLEPEKNAEDMQLFKRYRSAGYPTLLFATADGEELDRLGDFLPADEFLAVIDRIEAGDIFAARRARLDREPGNFELLERVHRDLMVRGDFPHAYARFDAFQAANPELEPDPSLPLQLETLARQQRWLYRGAARLYPSDWESMPEIEEPRAAPSLMALLAEGLPQMPPRDQAERLRKARHDDAGRILDMLPESGLPSTILREAADFAHENGHYDVAAELYLGWYETAEVKSPGDLNSVAWSLYLSRRELESAVEMARAAYARDPRPNVADTLAQLLYVTGAVDEAIEVERQAAAEAEGDAAEGYAAVVARMEEGESLVDKPDFETYPD